MLAFIGFVLTSCGSACAGGLIPVHGFVLAPIRRGRVIMRLDPVVDMLRGGIYRVSSSSNVPAPGTEVDALVTQHAGGLALQGEPTPAAAYVAGTPNAVVKHTVEAGVHVPAYSLVDQDGRPFRFNDLEGKVTLLSFIFTRCDDVCLTISAKFGVLQRLLDPRKFHLVEVTIDPMYDSPAVLAAYGRKFHVRPQMWTLATGESSIVADMVDSFGVSSLSVSDKDYLHDTRLVLIGPHGVVREVDESAGWDPSNVAAEVRTFAGLPSNPLRRFWFETFAQVSAFCGGNQSVAITMMLCVLIPLIAAVTIPVLLWWRKRIFA